MIRSGPAHSNHDQAHRLFDAALACVREMPAEADPGVREFASAANMVAQTAPEARWVIDHTPIDTIGARARALADVAAELARAGDSRAEAVFAEAESVAAQIGSEGIQAVFAEHTADYIAARRNPTPEAAQPDLTRAELEARLQAAERMPHDGQGFHAITLLNLAKALLAAGQVARARSVEAIKAGAQGYLLKTVTGGRDLLEAVAGVAAGEAIITPALAPRLLAEFATLARGAEEQGADE